MGKGPEGKVRSHEPVERLIPLDCRHLSEISRIARLSFSKQWTEKDFAYFLAHECGACFGVIVEAEGRDTLRAYFLGLLVQGDLDIVSVATDPQYRRRGLAEKLMELAVHGKGVVRAFLEVDTDNPSAIALYEKLGFSTTGRRRGYYEGKRDAFVMTYGKSPKKT